MHSLFLIQLTCRSFFETADPEGGSHGPQLSQKGNRMDNRDASRLGGLPETEICFRFLKNGEALSDENALALSRLVYDTDPYIYPAMFGSRENAEALLPLLFGSNDSMFCLSNCYVAEREGAIIGLLLWKQGALTWSPALLKRLAAERGIPLSPYLDMVSEEYVSVYEQLPEEDVLSLINLCVVKELCGRGIGRKILENFFAQKPAAVYELCALKDNSGAVHLYTSLGFEICEEYNGFSVDHRRLPALRMRRSGSHEQ